MIQTVELSLLTEGEIKKLQENRSEQIREKLSETDDGTGNGDDGKRIF